MPSISSAPARETEAEKPGWTPGPWRFQKSHALIESVFGAPGRTIANIHGLSDEDEANARLIAAAPEMYEALKDCLDRFVEAFPACKEFEPIKRGYAALVKATGAQS